MESTSAWAHSAPELAVRTQQTGRALLRQMGSVARVYTCIQCVHLISFVFFSVLGGGPFFESWSWVERAFPASLVR